MAFVRPSGDPLMVILKEVGELRWKEAGRVPAICKALKLHRASGECLGATCRRRTCQATIRGRERQARIDLPISEWGNPAGVMTCHRLRARGTRGTETSKYPQEEKADAIALVAASERAPA